MRSNAVVESKRLGDFVRIRTGKLDANASSEDGEYPFFTCAIDPLRIATYSYDCECVLVAGNGDLNVKYFEGKFDAYQRTYIIESLSSHDLCVRYLFHFMSIYVAKLRQLSIGGVIKYIKLGNLTEAQIPLPPLSEQKRIAEILDLAEALRAKRRAALALVDELTQSIFLDMFGDPVTNPKDVNVVCLEDVTTRITDGVHQKPNYTESGTSFISVKDITTGTLRFDQCKFISNEDHERFTKRCKAERFDILYTKVGATYGRPAIVETDREFSLYVSVCLIKPNKDLIDPYFLNAALGTSAVKSQADGRIKGIGVPDLHLDQIRKFRIPLPPMRAQQTFAMNVSAVERSKEAHRHSLRELDQLFASLQHRAFRGEL